MSLLWLPETTPPQVSDEAQEAVAARVLGEGVVPTSREALDMLEDGQEVLVSYIDRLGFDLNQVSAEGLWPARVLKMGAAVSLLAYRETGYFQTVDDEAFALGSALARLDGIPEAYLSSLWQDSKLQNLVSIVTEARDFQAPNPEGYHQVLEIGAGCVRYYMQQALAA